MKGIFKGKTLALSVVALLVLLAGLCIGVCGSSSAANGQYEESQTVFSDGITINVIPVEIERIYPETGSYFSIPANGELEMTYRIRSLTTSPYDLVVNIDYRDGVLPQPGSGFSYEFKIIGQDGEWQYSPGSMLTIAPEEEVWLTVKVFELNPSGQFFLQVEFVYPYTPFG